MKTIKVSISDLCPFFYFVHQLAPLLAVGLNTSAYSLYTHSAIFNGSALSMNMLTSGGSMGLTLALPFFGFASDFVPLTKVATISNITFTVSQILALIGLFLTGGLSNTGSIIFFVGYLISGLASAGVMITSLMTICEIRNKGERQLSISVMFMLLLLGQSLGAFISGVISSTDPSPTTQTIPGFSLCIVVIVLGGVGIFSVISMNAKLRKSGQSMVSSQPDPPKVDPPVLAIMVAAAICFISFIVVAYSSAMLFSIIPFALAAILFIAGMAVRNKRAKKMDKNILVPRRRLKLLPFFSLFPVFAGSALNLFVQELLASPFIKCPIQDAIGEEYKVNFGIVYLFNAIGSILFGLLSWSNFKHARVCSLVLPFCAILLAILSWFSEVSEYIASKSLYSVLVLNAVIGVCSGGFLSVICARLMPLFRYGESGIASATVLSCLFIGQMVGRIIPLFSELIVYNQDTTCYSNYIGNTLLFGLVASAVFSTGLIVIPTAADDVSEDLMARI